MLPLFAPGAAQVGAKEWDLSVAAYSGNRLDLNYDSNSAKLALCFNEDHDAFLVGGGGSVLRNYVLSNADDISTASYASLSTSGFAVGTGAGSIDAAGEKIVVVDTTSAGKLIRRYNLSTGFDPTSFSDPSQSFSYATQCSSTSGQYPGFCASEDGTKGYLIGNPAVGTDTTVWQYTLGTPWDVTTMSYASKLKDVSTEITFPANTQPLIAMSPSGEKMWLARGGNTDRVYQYTLGTPFDVSTATYDSVSFDISTQVGDAGAIWVDPAGYYFYVYDATTEYLYQYNM